MFALVFVLTCVNDSDRLACRSLGFGAGLADGYDEGFVQGWIAAGGDPADLAPADTGAEDPGGSDDPGGAGDPGSGDPGA